MNHRPARAVGRLGPLCCVMAASALLSACIVEPQRYPPPRPQPVYQPAPPVYNPPPQQVYAPEQEEPVVSVYIDPPTYQPAPIAVAWAPPPMLVEEPPPQPWPDAVWTGGYWAWQGRWVWAAGRWSAPPQPSYAWVQPYYEHRDDRVIFVPGYWSPPEVRFVPPPLGIQIAIGVVAAGVIIGGHPPVGPQGCFVPPPPGSRHGLIVPAPVGTPPAVVVSAPPVVNVGMRITGNVNVNNRNTTINDNRVTNITNVTIVAPPGAMASGQAYQGQVPARAHLAASLPAVVHATAPVPASNNAIPSYVPGRQPVALPAAQAVRTEPARPFNGGQRGESPNGGRPGAQDPQRANGEFPGRPGQPQAAQQQAQPGQPMSPQQQRPQQQQPGQPQQVASPQHQPAQALTQQQPGGQPQQPQFQGQPGRGQQLPPQGQPAGQSGAQPTGQAGAQPQAGDPRAHPGTAPNGPGQNGRPGAVPGQPQQAQQAAQPGQQAQPGRRDEKAEKAEKERRKREEKDKNDRGESERQR